MPVDAETQAAIDALAGKIEELAALHAQGAPAAKIEAKEEQVERAAERAGLSDEDADKLADRISAKLASAIDPDALAEKVAGNLKEWADDPEPGDEELQTIAGRNAAEPTGEETGEEPTAAPAAKEGEEVAPDGDGGKPPAHWSDRPFASIFK